MTLLIVYDVAEDRARRRVDRMLAGYGRRLQRSVYLCRLRRAEVAALQRRAQELANTAEDAFSLRAFAVQMPPVVAVGPDAPVAEAPAPPDPCFFIG